jgi:hypothetical protein
MPYPVDPWDHEMVFKTITCDDRINRARTRVPADDEMREWFDWLTRHGHRLPTEDCPVECLDVVIDEACSRTLEFRHLCMHHESPTLAITAEKMTPDCGSILVMRGKNWVRADGFFHRFYEVYVGQCPKCLTIFYAIKNLS